MIASTRRSAGSSRFVRGYLACLEEFRGVDQNTKF